MQNESSDEEIEIVIPSRYVDSTSREEAISKETLATNQTTKFTKTCIVILTACLCVFGAKLFLFNDQPSIVTNQNERKLQADGSDEEQLEEYWRKCSSWWMDQSSWGSGSIKLETGHNQKFGELCDCEIAGTMKKCLITGMRDQGMCIIVYVADGSFKHHDVHVTYIKNQEDDRRREEEDRQRKTTQQKEDDRRREEEDRRRKTAQQKEDDRRREEEDRQRKTTQQKEDDRQRGGEDEENEEQKDEDASPPPSTSGATRPNSILQMLLVIGLTCILMIMHQ